VKIIVIEDHKLVRDMLAAFCRNIVPDGNVYTASNGQEGVSLSEKIQPDLIFLDLVLPDCDGLDLLGQLQAVSVKSKVIALTSFTDEFTVHRALQTSISGFITKNEQPLGMLKEAIETVMSGGRYFPPAVQKLKASLRSDPASFDKLLSTQEQRLLSLFGEGLGNQEIAARVNLSANTVKVHRQNILRKLGIHSTPELMNYALEKGFTRIRRSLT
jgi:DNA-binding NarL/FixJ family response regulator